MTTYTINNQTTALISAKQIGYQTHIIEKDTQFYTTDTALDIINATCKEDWATYQARKTIVTQRTGYKQNLPIPVSIRNKIIAVPTHSPHNIECSWIILNKHTKLTQNKNQIELIISQNPYRTIPLRTNTHHPNPNQTCTPPQTAHHTRPRKVLIQKKNYPAQTSAKQLLLY